MQTWLALLAFALAVAGAAAMGVHKWLAWLFLALAVAVVVLNFWILNPR